MTRAGAPREEGSSDGFVEAGRQLRGNKAGKLDTVSQRDEAGMEREEQRLVTWKGEEEEIEGSPGEDGARLKLWRRRTIESYG